MIQYNYDVLRWTKDVMDDLILREPERSKEEIILFLQKASENLSIILHQERVDSVLDNICPN